MQSSARDTEPSDYQQLYRKHVHENMMLHENMKSIEGVEKNRIKELQNNALQFKGKYKKYLKKNSRSKTSDTKWRKSGTDYKHRSAVIVCKNFAYPARAWHDLVDVSKTNLDVYKSEILSSSLGERPDDQDQTQHTCNHCAPITPRSMHKLKRNPYYKEDENNNALPFITLKDCSNTQSPPPIVIVQDIEHYSGTCSARGPGSSNLPRISRSSEEHDRGNQSGLSKGLSSTSLDTARSDSEMCYVGPYRRRSQTISSTINHAPIEIDPGLPRLNSFHSLTESGWMKLKGKVHLAVTLAGEDSPQVKTLARRFENLKHCRYLRYSSDKSSDEGLDSTTYSREKLNEIV